MGKIFNTKSILLLLIIIAAGYLTTKFPDEAVLVAGVSIIIVIGIWLLQIEKENK